MNAISNDISLKIQTGHLTYNSTNVTIINEQISKQLNIVYLNIFVTRKNLVANQWNSIGTIPSEFVPTTTITGVADNATDTAQVEYRVYSNGNVEVYPNASGTKNVSIVVSYITMA